MRNAPAFQLKTESSDFTRILVGLSCFRRSGSASRDMLPTLSFTTLELKIQEINVLEVQATRNTQSSTILTDPLRDRRGRQFLPRVRH
ncbi:hypothetical protein AVEN_147616-1 [Araneus ventricosus]|uniref:Uncharacterized protein n=1 Tax=Araneus ventricosus TaxID=182803 RepID=A0A4Y2H5M4_ARAVE|nr:hypothetical protein AVEN_147616-1 [Araneus ventricosus]